jgi:hypothetical protein
MESAAASRLAKPLSRLAPMKPMIFSTPAGSDFGMMSTRVSDRNVPGATTVSTIIPAMPPSEAPMSAGLSGSVAATAIRSSAKRSIP